MNFPTYSKNKTIGRSSIVAAMMIALLTQTYSQTSAQASRKLILVSDNQENLMTGAPLKSMSGMADRLISVAKRSPLANVGGRLLLREAIRSGKEMGGDLVLHLGDASNISCPDELSPVIAAMNEEAGDSWYMTPGNHDGFLAGNFDYSVTKDFGIYSRPPNDLFRFKYQFTWIDACTVPSRGREADILTRGDAVDQYVRLLNKRSGTVSSARSPEPKGQTIKLEDGPTIELRCQFETINNPSNNFSAYARICGREPKYLNNPESGWIGPQHSFIVQKLDYAGKRIVLLDTSDYADPAQLLTVATKGNISERQMDQVNNGMLLDSAGKQIDPQNIIMAGHHPFDELSEDVREWIARSAARYISGHKHKAANLSTRKTKDGSVEELNIGSTLDFPPQMVLADFEGDNIHLEAFGANGSDNAFVKSCLDESGKNRWPLSKKIYSKYRSGPYAKHLLSALREASAMHDRVIGDSPMSIAVPTGDNVRDWLLLEDALTKINATDGPSRTFWACQAYYASKATQHEGRLERTFLKLFRKQYRFREVVKGRIAFRLPV